MTIGDKIYELRNSRNMSLREFAALTGVTHTTIARLESTSFAPQKIYLDTIYQICKKLNYDFAEFLTETGYIQQSHKEPVPTVRTMYETTSLTEKEKALLQAFRNLLPETQDFVLRAVGITDQKLFNKN